MSNKKAADRSKTNRRLSNATGGQTSSLPGALKNQIQGSSKLSPLHELKRLSFGSQSSLPAITFGKPHSPNSAKSSASAGSPFSNLLSTAGSQSVTKLIGGGLLSFGTSSLFSAISDLFGGSQGAPPPVQLFALPQSQQATVYETSNGVSSVNNGATTDNRGTQGTYNLQNGAANQAAIVNAVKNALLTSSSLNDIIGEL